MNHKSNAHLSTEVPQKRISVKSNKSTRLSSLAGIALLLAWLQKKSPHFASLSDFLGGLLHWLLTKKITKLEMHKEHDVLVKLSHALGPYGSLPCFQGL